MSENKVIIEFIADTSQLESASSSFEKLGVTEKKVLQDMGSTLSKTNAQQKESTEIIDKNTRSVNDLAKATQNAQKAAVGDFGKKALLDVIKVIETNTNSIEQLEDAILVAKEALNYLSDPEDIKLLNKMIAETEAHVKLLGKNTEEATGKQASFRSQIRQSTEELAQMAANGEITVEKLLQIASASGEMQDNLGDAKQAIQALASDTFPLDALLQGVTSITAGFQVAQGAAALFGDENEDLQKVLVRLNAVMAITQGLQAILNNLQKTSAQSLGLNIAAQKLYTFVVGESTGAVAAFRVALAGLVAASGIGLLIAVAVNWQKIKDAISGTNEEMRKQGELRTEAAKGISSEIAEMYRLKTIILDQSLSYKTRNDALAHFREIAPEYGQDLKTLQDAEKELGDVIIKQTELLVKREEVRIIAGRIAERELNKQTETEVTAWQKVNQALIFAVTNFSGTWKNRLDIQKKTNEKIYQEQTDADKKMLELLVSSLKNYNETGLKETNKQDDFAKKVLEAKRKAVEDEIALLEAQRINLKNNRYEVMKIDEELVIKRAKLAKIGEESEAKKVLIDKQTIEAIDQLHKDYFAKERKRLDDNLKSFKDVEAKKRAESAETNKLLQENLEDEYKKNKENSEKRLQALREENAAKQALYEEDKAKREEMKQQAIDQAFAIAQNIADGIFNIQAQSIRRELDADLNALYKKRDAELANKNLTEEQKARINDRYNKEELKLKKRAFDQEQNMKAVQAAINTALAVTMAFAQLGPIGGAIAAAALIAAMAVQIATIKTAKFPGFRKGTKNAPSGFKWVGEEGPELIHDKGGYPIITHGDSKVLAQMLDKYGIGHELKGGNIPQIPIPAANRSVIERSQLEKNTNNYHQSISIDYDKLGEAVGNQIAKHPKYNMSFDKNGFKTFVVEGNTTIEILNNKYD